MERISSLQLCRSPKPLLSLNSVATNNSCPHRNAGIVPIVYLFYPETAYRSLEEMDTIFRKTTSIFSVVRVANEEPRRYGKKGELLVDYSTTVEPLGDAGQALEKGIMAGQPLADRDGNLESEGYSTRESNSSVSALRPDG
jgi:hypothetical protein